MSSRAKRGDLMFEAQFDRKCVLRSSITGQFMLVALAKFLYPQSWL